MPYEMTLADMPERAIWIKRFPDRKTPLPRAARESEFIFFTAAELIKAVNKEDGLGKFGTDDDRGEVLGVAHLYFGGPEVPDVVITIGTGNPETAEAWLSEAGFELLKGTAELFERMGLNQEYGAMQAANLTEEKDESADPEPTTPGEGADAVP